MRAFKQLKWLLQLGRKPALPKDPAAYEQAQTDEFAKVLLEALSKQRGKHKVPRSVQIGACMRAGVTLLLESSSKAEAIAFLREIADTLEAPQDADPLTRMN